MRSPLAHSDSWRLSLTECLLAIAIALALAMASCTMWDLSTSGLAVRDAAVRFADSLRQAEVDAVNHDSTVTITILPAAHRARCTCYTRRGSSAQREVPLADGIWADGTVTFDPHGVPLHPARFHFRKGNARLMVQVDIKGFVAVR